MENFSVARVFWVFLNVSLKIHAEFFCTSQVARIVEVSEETRRNMGGNSGLELITLPYGHQLRLDLIER